MIFVFYMTDRPGTLPLRQEVRPRHRAYLALQAERIAFAGPLLADDGVTMAGSLLAIDFADRGAAQAWLEDEPFYQAGLYGEVKISAFMNLWPQKTGFPAGL